MKLQTFNNKRFIILTQKMNLGEVDVFGASVSFVSICSLMYVTL